MERIEEELAELFKKLSRLREEVHKKIVGQEESIEQLLIALLAGGHALLEGVPGLAKTLMIRSLAEAIDLPFRRIQFTPDLMPSDITGTEILEEDVQSGKRFFKFQPGPIFANIVLADEINRTPPKTQAALLEAMQEFAVSYGGESHPLDRPFFLLATQNPIEQAGTFPLPEAQLDRFLLYIKVDYPPEQEELDILLATTSNKKVSIESVMQGSDILRLQELVRDVHLSPDLAQYVNRLIRATRPDNEAAPDFIREYLAWGAGPRAGQAVILCAKARALLKERLAVQPEDIQAMLYPVLRHRILINFKAEAERIHPDQISQKLIEAISIQTKS